MKEYKFKINDEVTYFNPVSIKKLYGKIIMVVDIKECVTQQLVGETLYYFSYGQTSQPILLFEKDLKRIDKNDK